MAMAPSRNHHHLFLTAIFLSSLITPFSVGGMRWRDEEEVMRKKMPVLGSRPPACVNKCFSCRPCEATLVIPPHQTKIKPNHFQQSSHRDDDTYYLLSWKCRCGDKFYQP